MWLFCPDKCEISGVCHGLNVKNGVPGTFPMSLCQKLINIFFACCAEWKFRARPISPPWVHTLWNLWGAAVLDPHGLHTLYTRPNSYLCALKALFIVLLFNGCVYFFALTFLGIFVAASVSFEVDLFVKNLLKLGHTSIKKRL
jgi:hypothetical protein